MKPNASRHNPDPLYLRRLIERTGLRQSELATILGISERQVRYYIAPDAAEIHPAPYLFQFALEALANPR